MYLWPRKWESWQVLPALLSVLGYFLFMSLPNPMGLVLKQLFPGWLATYTPSTFLKGVFIKDRNGDLHWASTGRYTPKFISEFYDFILILAAGISFVVGWYSALINALSFLNELQSALTLLITGNFYGFIMGYVASKDRKVHTGLFGLF